VSLRFASSIAVAVALVGALESPAAADPTPWFSLGGGYGIQRNGNARSNDGAGAITAAIGVGTPSSHPLVLGGLFRTTGYVGLGVDLGVGLRLATRGFCIGDWGVAVDLGLGARVWGQGSYGNFPVQPALTFGLPYGLQIVAGADVGDVASDKPSAKGGFLALEIDLLRLTVMRMGDTTKTWPNPSPIGTAAPPSAITP
jgi:hypothetical protein